MRVLKGKKLIYGVSKLWLVLLFNCSREEKRLRWFYYTDKNIEHSFSEFCRMIFQFLQV